MPQENLEAGDLAADQQLFFLSRLERGRNFNRWNTDDPQWNQSYHGYRLELSECERELNSPCYLSPVAWK